MALRVCLLCVSLVLLQVVFNQEPKTQSINDVLTEKGPGQTSNSPEELNSDETLSTTPQDPTPLINNDNNNNNSNSTMKLKPSCNRETGCTPLLNCLNITSLLYNDSNYKNVTEIFGQRKAVKISPPTLGYIFDSPLFTNSCLLVMYYATWCPYSMSFMTIFKQLGRSFPSQLTTLAMDFDDKNQEKFLFAYVPRVLLYYSGRAVYDIDTSLSLNELTEILANLTRLIPIPQDPILPQEEEEMELPVEWKFDSTWYNISIGGILIVIIINVLKRNRLAVEWTVKCRDLIRNLILKIKRD